MTVLLDEICVHCEKPIPSDEETHSYHEPDRTLEDSGLCYCVGSLHVDCCRNCVPLIELVAGYYLLDGVIVDEDEEPVEADASCNCDIDYLCPLPKCIQRQLESEAYWLRRAIPAEWTEYMSRVAS